MRRNPAQKTYNYTLCYLKSSVFIYHFYKLNTIFEDICTFINRDFFRTSVQKKFFFLK